MSSAPATSSAPLQRYREAFETRWQRPDALTSIRRAALERFLACGFPTTRNEQWKYTNLRRLESRAFELASASPIDAAIPIEALASGSARLVFVNGHYVAGLSELPALPPGVTIVTLAQWIEHDGDDAARHLASNLDAATAPFDALNAAFFEDGVFIQLSRGAKLDAPIHLVHYWTAGTAPRMTHLRVFVRAGEQSRCTLVEHFTGADAENWTNISASIEVGKNARFEHLRVQEETTRAFHIGRIDVSVAERGHYACHDIAFGSSLARLDLDVRLKGNDATVDLKGLLTPNGTQHIDTHTKIEHSVPHTQSSEEYRGIAAGRARGVFNGKVVVHEGAQKTDARQSSRNLLLSPTAEIDTKPELEIYANDVKCSHGATTGQLDPASVFYLRSRGLSESEARAALIRAFASSVLTSITHVPMREYLERQLPAKLETSK
jgi:Fe-S cluster assembly protein SufD